jgi:thiol-disulfide isomerase/thioredoxin
MKAIQTAFIAFSMLAGGVAFAQDDACEPGAGDQTLQFVSTAADKADRPAVYTDPVAAWEQAKEEKVPLLIHITADWCHFCLKMNPVFDDPKFKEFVKTRKVVVLKLKDTDGDKMQVPIGNGRTVGLLKILPVKSWPSDFMIDPTKGGRAQTLKTGAVLNRNRTAPDRAAYEAIIRNATEPVDQIQ